MSVRLHSLPRREFLAFGAALFTPLAAAPSDSAAFRGVGLDHVVLRVTDPDRSVEFYRKYLGSPEIRLDEAEGRFLRLGKEFLALIPADQPGLDHFAVAIADYDPAAVAARSKEMGLTTRREGSRVVVEAPEGFAVEITPPEPSAAAAVVEEAPEKSVFRGVGVNHIAVRVSDLEPSADFYRRVFGTPVVQESQTSRFMGLDHNFVSLFLGEEPKLDHFCFEIEGYVPDEVVAKLESEGVKPRRTQGRVYFPDPDGLEVQLSAADHRP